MGCHSHDVSFEEFFASGKEESLSPFLTKSSKKWSTHLHLISSITSAVLLAIAFALSFTHINLSQVFLLFVYFLAGTPALIETIYDLGKFRINIDVLMTLAAFLSVLIGSEIEGALLLVLFDLSGSMEEMVTHKTKNAIQSLHKLSPTMAVVINDDNSHSMRAVREIPIKTKLLIKAGEIIPLDGVIMSGDSHVNLVHLTGESVPAAVHPKDLVQAGSLNIDGALNIEVTQTAADSTLSKVIKLIIKASEAKPKLQRFLDRFGVVYSTTVICLAGIFAIALPWLFSIPYLGLEGSIYRALAFLIAASPCALIIATPTAYLSAISACAKKGVLLKGGVTLDALAKCKVFAFDKTGTLTTGKLACINIDSIGDNGDCSEDEALSIAASIERHSTHPIAQAIVDSAEKKSLGLPHVENVKTVPGYGLSADVKIKEKMHKALIGNLEFISKNYSGDPNALKIKSKEGHLITFMMIQSAVFVFHFLDELRPQITQVMKDLREDLHLKTLMLTGDHSGSAKYVADSVGLDEYYSDLKPEQKLDRVSQISKLEGLAMVGDGINDGPALARANIGISLGQIGSSTAIEAADIVILKDDLTTLGWLYRRAKKTVRIVKENLSLALGVIALATTPALLGFIPLWLAVVLHEGGTIVVALNSLRLLKK